MTAQLQQPFLTLWITFAESSELVIRATLAKLRDGLGRFDAAPQTKTIIAIDDRYCRILPAINRGPRSARGCLDPLVRAPRLDATKTGYAITVRKQRPLNGL